MNHDNIRPWKFEASYKVRRFVMLIMLYLTDLWLFLEQLVR